MVSASESYSPDTLDSILRVNAQPLTGDVDEWLDLAARRNAWWDSCCTKSWLLEKGYALYHRTQSEWGPTTDMFPLSVEPRENPFPFAYFLGKSSGEDIFRADTGVRRTVAYAQNSQGQHFALKVILDGSEELRILKHLQRQRLSTSIDDFHNVIPIIDVIACEEHWLAVMPRWGDFPLLPRCNSIREAFHFIHCLLKGLVYLHEHRIAHGDIKESNIAVNHIKMHALDFVIADRLSLRSQGLFTYALFDFSGGTMFPPSTPLEECRLPYHVSFNTCYWQTTADTFQGEIDYNPFAFDVGMLGVLFCSEFQHLTPLAPMLAPLLDRMITRDIPQRFTALEALKFFEEEVRPQTSDHELNLSLPERVTPAEYDRYDRWKSLDLVFVEKWAAFRETPVPRWLRVLRYMCEYRYVFYTIVFARRIARYIRRMTFNPFAVIAI